MGNSQFANACGAIGKSQVFTSYFRFPILLFEIAQIAYCLLPIACCLLPVAYCLLPIEFGRIPLRGRSLPGFAYRLGAAHASLRSALPGSLRGGRRP
jgi:hypothetical protein